MKFLANKAARWKSTQLGTVEMNELISEDPYIPENLERKVEVLHQRMMSQPVKYDEKAQAIPNKNEPKHIDELNMQKDSFESLQENDQKNRTLNILKAESLFTYNILPIKLQAKTEQITFTPVSNKALQHSSISKSKLRLEKRQNSAPSIKPGFQKVFKMPKEKAGSFLYPSENNDKSTNNRPEVAFHTTRSAAMSNKSSFVYQIPDAIDSISFTKNLPEKVSIHDLVTRNLISLGLSKDQTKGLVENSVKNFKEKEATIRNISGTKKKLPKKAFGINKKSTSSVQIPEKLKKLIQNPLIQPSLKCKEFPLKNLNMYKTNFK